MFLINIIIFYSNLCSNSYLKYHSSDLHFLRNWLKTIMGVNVLHSFQHVPSVTWNKFYVLHWSNILALGLSASVTIFTFRKAWSIWMRSCTLHPVGFRPLNIRAKKSLIHLPLAGRLIYWKAFRFPDAPSRFINEALKCVVTRRCIGLCFEILISEYRPQHPCVTKALVQTKHASSPVVYPPQLDIYVYI